MIKKVCTSLQRHWHSTTSTTSPMLFVEASIMIYALPVAIWVWSLPLLHPLDALRWSIFVIISPSQYERYKEIDMPDMRLYTIPKSRIAMYPPFHPPDPLALLSPWETCSATLSDLLERIFPPTCLISSYPVLNQFIAENNFTEHACIELYHNKEPIKYGFLPLSSRGLGTSSILITALCSARPWKIWTTLMFPSSNFLLLSIPHYSIFSKIFSVVLWTTDTPLLMIFMSPNRNLFPVFWTKRWRQNEW